MGRELERAKSRIRDLEAELESARRAAKRQAAPFSKGPPVRRPARPGRQPGAAYGVRARRSIPEVIDEVCDAPLPGRCPDCGGELAEIGVVSEEAAAVLGKEYAGVLVRDGWAPYRKFSRATHQTCLAHLSRRCREMIADADRGQARVPHALARVLKEALAVRDARDAGSVSADAARETAGALTTRVDKLLAGHVRHPPNVRLRKHVATQRDALFTFLTEPGVDATNFRAEQAIRPIVVTRKVSGGNREWTGARAQEILCSVLRTCRLQGRDPQTTLIELVCSPTPLIAPIALGSVRGPPG